ncbi:helix-turn-helix domain-containing protein [Streptomyces sp. NPDC005731]|uniref:AraC-like ligand-binding domain-containing protein n=1 Tax=unclassified Streptomyces TaxID=2593676 RepID=UPI0033DDE250
MTTTTWRTETVPLEDRAEALRQTIRRQVVPVELVLPRDPECVYADVAITDIGALQVSSVRANPATVHRTAKLARADDEPVVFISLQVSGESTVVQDGRSALLRPGDIALYDTRRPYTLLFDRGVDMHFFRVPVRDIALPDKVIGQAVARRLGPEGMVSGVTAGYLARLAESSGQLDATAAHLLAAPSMELIRAVLAAQSDRPRLMAGALHETLAVRILEHMREHVADPDLSPASVARAHHISVRHLYAILARNGIGFGDWVRAERLDACRRELSRVPPTTETIAALARRWGFKSPSHFSRAFKAAYGMSPQAWRESRHPS